ncbi:MAG: YybH family protein [Thermoplasmata archaeon]
MDSPAVQVASHFTDDSIFLPQNSGMQRGRVAIQQWFRSWLPSTTVEDFVIHTEDLEVVGNTAYEVGTHRMTMRFRGGKSITDEGKFLMVYQRGPDGRWRISRDMYNSSRPTAPS